MILGRTVLAVIPARSGSKRCTLKNFRDFRGRALYEWSIEAARKSKYIDHFILSTDKDRPPELCTDTATNEDVLRFHLERWKYDIVVLLQPTSPLRIAYDIDRCIEFGYGRGACVSYRPDGTKNGAVYMAHSEWIAKHDFDAPHKYYEMPDERSLDIDYQHQFNEP